METAYFRLSFDPERWPRWFPGEPRSEQGEEVDARTFTSCSRYTRGALVLPTDAAGPRSPITFGPFDLPVVDVSVGEKFFRLAGDDVQLVSAAVEDGNVYILNALRSVECIDETRTMGETWSPEAGRPDKIGEYRTVLRLFIDPVRARGAHVFRPTGWHVALIVSSEMAARLDDRELGGTRLEPVT
jgi:hypothetical protein